MRALPIPASHASALARLRDVAPELEVAVVGAIAVQHHVPLRRKTADIDLVLAVELAAIDATLARVGWRRDQRIPHRWYGDGGFRADVLPSTPELLAAGTLQFDGDGRVMSLLGLDLVFAHAEPAALEGTGHAIAVASLPTLFVLKSISWLDRPGERSRDLGDLARMLEHALDEDDDRRFDAGPEVGGGALPFEEQGACFLGYHVARIVGPKHRSAVEDFLARALDTDATLPELMAREGQLEGHAAGERVRAMLGAFRDALAG